MIQFHLTIYSKLISSQRGASTVGISQQKTVLKICILFFFNCPALLQYQFILPAEIITPFKHGLDLTSTRVIRISRLLEVIEEIVTNWKKKKPCTIEWAIYIPNQWAFLSFVSVKEFVTFFKRTAVHFNKSKVSDDTSSLSIYDDPFRSRD